MRSSPRRARPGLLLAAAGASLLAACASTPDTPPASPGPGAAAPPVTSPGEPTGATKGGMTSPSASPTAEHHLTGADLQALVSGQDGADLETVRKDGQPAAMRLFGVRPGSVAARLGAQNGDLIESINAVPVGAPNATGQWTQLAMSEKRLTVQGSRQGQPFTTVLVIDGR